MYSDPRTVGWADKLRADSSIDPNCKFEIIDVGVPLDDIGDLIRRYFDAKAEIKLIKELLYPLPPSEVAETTANRILDPEQERAVARIENNSTEKLAYVEDLFAKSLPMVEHWFTERHPDYAVLNTQQERREYIQGIDNGIEPALAEEIANSRSKPAHEEPKRINF